MLSKHSANSATFPTHVLLILKRGFNIEPSLALNVCFPLPQPCQVPSIEGAAGCYTASQLQSISTPLSETAGGGHRYAPLFTNGHNET